MDIHEFISQLFGADRFDTINGKANDLRHSLFPFCNLASITIVYSSTK
jgi:hypothetical protein